MFSLFAMQLERHAPRSAFRLFFEWSAWARLVPPHFNLCSATRALSVKTAQAQADGWILDGEMLLGKEKIGSRRDIKRRRRNDSKTERERKKNDGGGVIRRGGANSSSRHHFMYFLH